MNYEATINVDGVYVGKSAYRRQRLLNTAKMTGIILTSAVASPLTGAALGIALEAGFSYVEGKLMRASTVVDQGDPSNGTRYWYNNYQGSCWGSTATLCGWQQNLDSLLAAYKSNNPNLTNTSWSVGTPFNNGLSVIVTLSYKQNGLGPYTQQFGLNGYGTRTPTAEQVPVTSATDAAALAQLQPKLDGMNATVAHNLADWAWKTKGIDVGTFTDYQGNVIAGPFDFPLPAKTSSYIDPTTGIRYDTNVVQSVHVEANTDPATSEADPLKLTQNETEKKTETAPDGSKKETTKTTTIGGAANQQKDQTDAGTPFVAPDGALYEKKSKTFGDVFNGFTNTIKGAPWYVASVGFFSVTIGSASCPHWAVPASRWTPVLDAGPYVCSTTATTMYALGGAIVLAVAAWAAFRIAFL